MNPRQQSRKSLPQHARPSKPPPLARRANSYNYAHCHHSHSQSVGSRSGPALSPKGAGPQNDDDDDDVDMESFLQFCATCERQIITPGNSILYCSESCRRKDSISHPSLSYPQKHSPILAATMSYFDHHHFDHRTPDIVPQRSPTVVRPISLTFSDLLISETGSPTDLTSYNRHRDSETSQTSNPSQPIPWTGLPHSTTRPHLTRHSTTGQDTTPLPSLIHSPSSSLGSSAASSTRPGPWRTSTSHRSLDLVSPACCRPASSASPPRGEGSRKSSASTLTSLGAVEAAAVLAYEKRPAAERRRESDARSSLQHLCRA